MITSIRLFIKSDCPIKSMHNFDQLCSEILSFPFFSYNYWTTAYLQDWGDGGIHLGDVFFLRDKEVPNIQIFRIYNLVSKYMFIKQKSEVNHNIWPQKTVLSVSVLSYFFMEKKLNSENKVMTHSNETQEIQNWRLLKYLSQVNSTPLPVFYICIMGLAMSASAKLTGSGPNLCNFEVT